MFGLTPHSLSRTLNGTAGLYVVPAFLFIPETRNFFLLFYPKRKDKLWRNEMRFWIYLHYKLFKWMISSIILQEYLWNSICLLPCYSTADILSRALNMDVNNHNRNFIINKRIIRMCSQKMPCNIPWLWGLCCRCVTECPTVPRGRTRRAVCALAGGVKVTVSAVRRTTFVSLHPQPRSAQVSSFLLL